MKSGIQSIFLAMGEFGCFVFCLIEMCTQKFGYTGNTLDAIMKGIEGGYIAYNEKDPKDVLNGYVKDTYGFIRCLTGKNVKEVRQEITGFDKKPIEGAINFWQLQNAIAGKGHFTYGSFNPLAYSYTVENGFLRQIRRYEVTR